MTSSPKLPKDSLTDEAQDDATTIPPPQSHQSSITPRPPPPTTQLSFLPPPVPVQTNGLTRKRVSTKGGRLLRLVKTRPPRRPVVPNRDYLLPPQEDLNTDKPQPFSDANVPDRGFGRRNRLSDELEFGFQEVIEYSDEGRYEDLALEHWGVDRFEFSAQGDSLEVNQGADFDFRDEELLDESGLNPFMYDRTESGVVDAEAFPTFNPYSYRDRDGQDTHQSVPGVVEFGIAQSREDDFNGTWFRDRPNSQERPKRDRDVPGGLVQLARTTTRMEWRQDEDSSVGATKYQVDEVYHASMRQALSGVISGPKVMSEAQPEREKSRRTKEDDSIKKSLKEVEKVEESTDKWMENAKPPAKRRRIRPRPEAGLNFDMER